MIKMLQYKMYPAGELRCPTAALVKLTNNIVSFEQLGPVLNNWALYNTDNRIDCK